MCEHTLTSLFFSQFLSVRGEVCALMQRVTWSSWLEENHLKQSAAKMATAKSSSYTSRDRQRGGGGGREDVCVEAGEVGQLSRVSLCVWVFFRQADLSLVRLFLLIRPAVSCTPPQIWHKMASCAENTAASGQCDVPISHQTLRVTQAHWSDLIWPADQSWAVSCVAQKTNGFGGWSLKNSFTANMKQLRMKVNWLIWGFMSHFSLWQFMTLREYNVWFFYIEEAVIWFGNKY